MPTRASKLLLAVNVQPPAPTSVAQAKKSSKTRAKAKDVEMDCKSVSFDEDEEALLNPDFLRSLPTCSENKFIRSESADDLPLSMISKSTVENRDPCSAGVKRKLQFTGASGPLKEINVNNVGVNLKVPSMKTGPTINSDLLKPKAAPISAKTVTKSVIKVVGLSKPKAGTISGKSVKTGTIKVVGLPNSKAVNSGKIKSTEGQKNKKSGAKPPKVGLSKPKVASTSAESKPCQIKQQPAPSNKKKSLPELQVVPLIAKSSNTQVKFPHRSKSVQDTSKINKKCCDEEDDVPLSLLCRQSEARTTAIKRGTQENETLSDRPAVKKSKLTAATSQHTSTENQMTQKITPDRTIVPDCSKVPIAPVNVSIVPETKPGSSETRSPRKPSISNKSATDASSQETSTADKNLLQMTPDGTDSSSKIPAAPLNVSDTRTPFEKPTSTKSATAATSQKTSTADKSLLKMTPGTITSDCSNIPDSPSSDFSFDVSCISRADNFLTENISHETKENRKTTTSIKKPGSSLQLRKSDEEANQGTPGSTSHSIIPDNDESRVKPSLEFSLDVSCIVPATDNSTTVSSEGPVSKKRKASTPKEKPGPSANKTKKAKKGSRASRVLVIPEEDSASDRSEDTDDEDLPLYRTRRSQRLAFRKVNQLNEDDSPEESSGSDSDPDDLDDLEENAATVEINNTSDSESTPLQLGAQKKGGKKKKVEIQWTGKTDIPEVEIIPENYEAAEKVLSPTEYFSHYFDDDLLNLMVEQTNLNSFQRDGKSVEVTLKEMKVFIAILIYMGINRLPSIRDYWKSLTRVAQVADHMTWQRFMKIRAYLHFADNSHPSADDRLWKIRPVMESIRRKCVVLEQKEMKLSIDESMVPYKGKKAGNLRQYIKNKPHKWGFKFFLLTSSTGIVYNFYIYDSGDTYSSASLSKAEEELGLGGKTLVALSKAIKSPEHKVLSFDNFFTSVEVLVYLRDNMQLVSLGTVRANRLRNPPLLPDKPLSKTRGAFDYCLSDSKVVVVKWADNKVVHIASTYIGVGSEPLPTVKRWCKDKGVHVQVSAPKCIAEYNQTMGGVDKFDHLCELYRMSSRAKRWYLPIFIFMLNMTLTNSWLLYKKDALELNQKIMPSKDFRLEIYQSWVTSCVRKAGRPALAEDTIVKKKYIKKPRPLQEVRYDSYEHWPSWSCSQSRCAYCRKGKTLVTCMKCDVTLCFLPARNCFVHFHAL